jgi:hypothetical protein
MLAGLDAMAGCLDAEHRDVGIVEERVEQPDRVRSAAHRGDQQVGQAALGLEDLRAVSVPITDWKSRTSSG